MSDITDAQSLASYNARGQKYPVDTTGKNAVQSPTSGTAFQISKQRDADLYINITTAAALAIAMGPDSSTAISLNASESDALGLIHLFVPAGWYVKLTGTMADLTITSILR